jgi:hypothetical protein
LPDALGASKEIPSKILITTKTRFVITRSQTSTAITLSYNVFSMEIKKQTCPMMAIDSEASRHFLQKLNG